MTDNYKEGVPLIDGGQGHTGEENTASTTAVLAIALWGVVIIAAIGVAMQLGGC